MSCSINLSYSHSRDKQLRDRDPVFIIDGFIVNSLIFIKKSINVYVHVYYRMQRSFVKLSQISKVLQVSQRST